MHVTAKLFVMFHLLYIIIATKVLVISVSLPIVKNFNEADILHAINQHFLSVHMILEEQEPEQSHRLGTL